MSTYAEFFLKSKSNVVQLELIEISHPAFTRVYRVVRNMVKGVTVTLETGAIETFSFYPLSIELGSSRDDLDQSMTINLGDLGEVLPKELDAVRLANYFNVKPKILYRIFRSDNLKEVMYGPILLEVDTFAFTREGAAFEAKAPSLNVNKTGELYKFDRFKMLRGFL